MDWMLVDGLRRRHLHALPVPLASDSLDRSNGALGSTDGLGHAFPGGGGLAWTSRTGTLSLLSNTMRATALGGYGFAAATVDAGASDVLVVANPVANNPGASGVMLRRADASNYIIAYVAPQYGSAVLKKCVATVESTIASGNVTYGAAKELAVRASGQSVSLYYDGVQVGSTATVADAALQTGTSHGVYLQRADPTVNCNYLSVWPLGEPSVASKRVVRVYRESPTILRVRVPIPGEANRIVAEWQFRQATVPVPGWSSASGVWCVQGLSVVDLDGVQGTKTLESYGTSAWEYSFKVGADADAEADYEFFGVAAHQAEVLAAFAIALDGVDVSTLPIGLTAYGGKLVVTQAINTIYPKDKTTVIGASALTHTFRCTGGLFVDHSHSFDSGYQAYSAYSAMAPTTNGDGTGTDTCQVGALASHSRQGDDAKYDLGSHATQIQFWHSTNHAYRLRMTLPSGGPDVAGDWSHTGTYGSWVQDTTSGLLKGYANWVSTVFADRITAAASSHQTMYQVVRV